MKYKRRSLTPEQQAAAAAKREKFRALVKRIAEMTHEDRVAMCERTGSIPTAGGRLLSEFNSCCLIAQMPTVTMVGGYRQWQEAGRFVRKGEVGLNMWVPRIKQGDAAVPALSEIEDKMRFAMATVFDITQTDEMTGEATSDADDTEAEAA